MFGRSMHFVRLVLFTVGVNSNMLLYLHIFVYIYNVFPSFHITVIFVVRFLHKSKNKYQATHWMTGLHSPGAINECRHLHNASAGLRRSI